MLGPVLSGLYLPTVMSPLNITTPFEVLLLAHVKVKLAEAQGDCHLANISLVKR